MWCAVNVGKADNVECLEARGLLVLVVLDNLLVLSIQKSLAHSVDHEQVISKITQGNIHSL